MLENVLNIIQYSSESHAIDFKREQYPIGGGTKKHELLKDISAMANHLVSEDKYIIIGVVEKDGSASDFQSIEDLVDEAKYQQYINNNIEPNINFEYKAFEYNGYKLAYFKIFQNIDRPYLIKKGIKDPEVPSKVVYREGDGFIRVGTSTKKMTRQDFDHIYNSKLKKPDRKSDIKIIPNIEESTFTISDNIRIICFDISVENTSNHSISIDVEMNVYKNENIKIISEYDLKNELNLNKNSLIPEFPSLRVQIKDFDEYMLISKSKLVFQDSALTIPQQAIEKNVFEKNLYIIENEPTLVKADIIVRSDSFSDGALVKRIEIKSDQQTL